MGSSECMRHIIIRTAPAQGPAPTDGAGVLSSVTGPRGAGDAIASDMRQTTNKQRAAKDL
eukprot:scaffold18211_cov124-Isochrysis_galbana.AAC.2